MVWRVKCVQCNVEHLAVLWTVFMCVPASTQQQVRPYPCAVVVNMYIICVCDTYGYETKINKNKAEEEGNIVYMCASLMPYCWSCAICQASTLVHVALVYKSNSSQWNETMFWRCISPMRVLLLLLLCCCLLFCRLYAWRPLFDSTWSGGCLVTLVEDYVVVGAPRETNVHRATCTPHTLFLSLFSPLLSVVLSPSICSSVYIISPASSIVHVWK